MLACLACGDGRQQSSDNFLPVHKRSRVLHSTTLGEAVDVFTCTILTSCPPLLFNQWLKESLSEKQYVISVSGVGNSAFHTTEPWNFLFKWFWKCVWVSGVIMRKKSKPTLTCLCTFTEILSYIYIYENPHYGETLGCMPS